KTVMRMEMMMWLFMRARSSGQPRRVQQEVDGLDADERDDHAAQTVQQEIAPQDAPRAERAILNALQREWNQRDDDQRVEDDRGENRALRRGQPHDVERLQLGERGQEQRGD